MSEVEREILLFVMAGGRTVRDIKELKRAVKVWHRVREFVLAGDGSRRVKRRE